MNWFAFALALAPLIVVLRWLARVDFRASALSRRHRSGAALMLALTMSGLAWLVAPSGAQIGLRVVSLVLFAIFLLYWLREPAASHADIS